MTLYLEYGIRWPLNGGELHYVRSRGAQASSRSSETNLYNHDSLTLVSTPHQIDRVWTKPRKFWSYCYGIMFLLLGGSQANAIVFGQAVLTIASPGNPQDPRLVKANAIFLVACICTFQTFSRINYIRFSNIFAIYKVLLLTFVTVVGWLAVGGIRSPNGIPGPFGLDNLANDFKEGLYTEYGVAVSLLLVMRAYAGYEVVNYVSISSPSLKSNQLTYPCSLRVGPRRNQETSSR